MAVAAGVLLAPPAADADWPVARHDAQRTARTDGTCDITEPVVYWKRYLGGLLTDPAFLVHDVDADGAAEMLMIAGGSAMAKERTDAVVWRTLPLDLTAFAGLVDLDGDGAVELIARSTDRVYVLAPATGAILWAEPAGEMGTIGATRLGDVDGDDLPELIILECACCSVISGNTGFVRSFASGLATPTLLWEFPVARCGGQDALTLVDADGAGPLEVLMGDRFELALLDGATGAELARSPALGVTVQRSQCRAADLDGTGGEELVCVLNLGTDPATNDRKVFALRYQAATDELEQVWSRTLAIDAGELQWVDLVTDADGDGLPEVVVAASDDGADWTTHVMAGDTGATIGTIPGELIVGSAGVGTGAVLLTSTATHLSGWRLVAGTLALDWTLLDTDVQLTFDAALAARGSVVRRAATAQMGSDPLPDLITVKRSAPGQLTSYDLAAGDPAASGSYQFPAQVHAAGMWPIIDPTAAELQLAVARNDGILTLFEAALTPARADDDASTAALRTGGYYASGWRRVDDTPRVARIDDGAARVLVVDSRGSLVVLDASAGSFAAPPRTLWEIPAASGAAVIPGLDGERPGVVCRLLDQPPATPPTYSIAAYTGSGDELWRQPAPRVPDNDLVPGRFDGDGVPDLVFQWGDPGDVLLQTRAISGVDGATLWDATPVDPGAGRQPAGVAVHDRDGDGRDDVYHQAQLTQILSGADGSEQAASAAGPPYFLPTLIDVDDDAALEVVLHGGNQAVRALDDDLGAALFTSADDNRPFPYGAVADCGGGRQVLIEGSARDRPRLKVTELAGAEVGVEQSFVLAGGALYGTEGEAALSTSLLGQLTSATVHQDLTGAGRPSVVVGSTDGFLYAVDPCARAVDFVHGFGAAVGEAVFGDSDGDGRDEILVTVADGYLYALRTFAIAAPESALDTDPFSDDPADLADVETRSTLEATWTAVTGATGYEVAVVDSQGAYVTSPPWQAAGSETTLQMLGLPLISNEVYRVSVRAIGANGDRSTDTVSDGVRVRFAAGGDAGGDPPPGGGCCRAGGGDAVGAGLAGCLVLLVGMLRRRRR